MLALKSRFEKVLRRKIYWIGACGFIIFLLFRACSGPYYEKSSYHIGRSRNWPNIDFISKEKNIIAFSDDIFSAIANQEHMRFSLSIAPENQLLIELESGQLDGIITYMEPQVTTEKLFLFSDPYFLFGPVLVVPKGVQIDGLDSVRYKIIGILSQSPLILEVSKDASIQLKLYDNSLKALTDLKEGRIDGVILPALPAYIYTQTFYSSELKIATAPLNKDGLRLMALKNAKGEALINDFNKGLKDLKQNGVYDKLIKNWGLMNAEKIYGGT